MTRAATNTQAMTAEKRTAALWSVLAASAVTVLKIVTGLVTGSLGVLSEAAHSGIDLVAAAITLFSVQISDKPADEDHTYGHGKVESLSSLVETVLMIASCIWIVSEAVIRLRGKHLDLKFSIWPFLVILLSIAVDWARSRQLKKVAEKFNSQALEADALHFRTDIWSGVAVLCGLTATYAGERYGIQWLERADPIAALLVSCVILQVSWKLARRTVDALLDRTPPEVRRDVITAVSHVKDVAEVQRVRMRQSGAKFFADVTVGVPRSLSLLRSEEIVGAITRAVQAVCPESDVIVHTVPVATMHESVFDRVRVVAQRSGLAIHEVTMQEFDHKLHLEQHLEVPATMLLRDAHDEVTRIEAEMRREVPEIASIATHIESEEEKIEKPQAAEDTHLTETLQRVAEDFRQVMDVHDVVATRVGGHLQMSCHCTMPDDMRMAEVHRVMSELEAAFLRGEPEVSRLLIHPEPATDNRR